MRISDVNKNSFAGNRKNVQIADDNAKHRRAVLSEKKSPQPAEKPAEDTVTISEDAALKRKEAREEQKDYSSQYSMLMEQLDNARKQGEGMAAAMKEKIKCLQIAMRIMSGDKVPIEDERYLAEKDPELFAKSNMMKLQNPDPKEHDRISEDEETGDEDSVREQGASAASEDQPAGGEVSAEAIDGAEVDGSGDA